MNVRNIAFLSALFISNFTHTMGKLSDIDAAMAIVEERIRDGKDPVTGK